MAWPMNTTGPVGGDQPQDGKTERGFAGARFADDAERLALSQLDTDAIDCLDVPDNLAHHAALDRKPHFKVFRLDNDHGASGRGGAGSGFGSAASNARV